MRINLGSSDGIHPDFLNVDIWTPPNATAENFKRVDLRKPWPWADSSVEQLRAHDIFEHLPNKVFTMNEAFRVLKPDATLDLFIPTTDGRGAFQDPTHVSFWTPNDLFYYCEVFAEWKRFHESMGVKCNFKIPGADDATAAIGVINGCHRGYGCNVTKLHIVLEAIK